MILTLLYDASYAADINNPYKYAPSNDTCVVSRQLSLLQSPIDVYPQQSEVIQKSRSSGLNQLTV